MDGKSIDIKQEKLDKLKELFPEVFTEERVDWEKLKAALGEDINFSNERYVLNWAGKSDAFRALQARTTATLVPDREESVNFDSTDHIFIEGENLEVLKVLQKSYYGKIKMIYIDPPYNTGNDNFIYPDRFSENKDAYLKRIGDKDEEGYMTREGLFRKNSKDSGHYHSNWLSMMYPRLFLAKNLLKDDGVIFVSIDDNEVHNLRLVMNEIFGEENFIGQIIIKSNPRGSQSIKQLAIVHEYLLVYSKAADLVNELGIELNATMKSEYKYDDFKGGKYRLLGLRQRGGAWRRKDRPSLFFPIYVNPKTEEISLERTDQFKIKVLPIKPTTGEEGSWRWSKEKLLNDIYMIEARKIKRAGKEEWDIYQRDFLEKDQEERKTKAKTIWDEKEANYQNAANELKDLFEGRNYFDFPKPTYLIEKIIKIVDCKQSDIVIDFFSGSGTTAHTILELNKKDGCNRKFICVQLPEKCNEDSEAFESGFKTIADIAIERIRRVIKKIEEEEKEKKDLFTDDSKSLNLGFKVFKLRPSNFKIWRGDVLENGEVLEKQLDAFVDPINKDAVEDNMLFELLLKSGYDLNSKIEKKVCDKIVYYSIENGEMIIALSKINETLAKEIINQNPRKVLCLDKLFAGNDQLKTNTVLQMKDAGIEFKTI